MAMRRGGADEVIVSRPRKAARALSDRPRRPAVRSRRRGVATAPDSGRHDVAAAARAGRRVALVSLVLVPLFLVPLVLGGATFASADTTRAAADGERGPEVTATLGRDDPSAPATEPPGRRFTVVIDPGHGGRDPGTSARSGLQEKTLTLDIARRARFFLETFGDIDVVLTRETDAALPLAERVGVIRRARADLLVSLHLNYLPQTDVVLVESYHAGPRTPIGGEDRSASRSLERRERRARSDAAGTRSDDSARFARLVQRRVHDEVGRRALGAVDAGVKRENFLVLTAGGTPGALVELTCLSHPGEAERLRESRYRARLAAAIVDAIRDYRVGLARTPDDHDIDEGDTGDRPARGSERPSAGASGNGAAPLVAAPLPRAGRI